MVGVSRDSQQTNASFCESLKLPFAMVGDPNGSICKAYDVRWPLVGLARRVTYLVGKDRRIRLAHGSETNPEGHVKKVQEALAAG